MVFGRPSFIIESIFVLKSNIFDLGPLHVEVVQFCLRTGFRFSSKLAGPDKPTLKKIQICPEISKGETFTLQGTD
jgi:hypothetical protein